MLTFRDRHSGSGYREKHDGFDRNENVLTSRREELEADTHEALSSDQPNNEAIGG